MKPLFFIFGLGYTASFLVESLLVQGFEVVGTTRHLGNKQGNTKEVTHIDFFDEPKIQQYLKKATHILITIPPDKILSDVVLHHYKENLKNLSSIVWIGYLSSTGVYGDYQGQWVDEESTCLAKNTSAVLRWNAEKAWFQLAKQHKLPLHVFRLAGIYGPKRNALERLLAGKKYSLYKKDQVFSRIHVEDIVSVLIASMKQPTPLVIYNVADDEPCAAHLLDAYAASLLMCPVPPLLNFEEATLSLMEKEFYSANRRISNEKIKKELQIHLKYPSYREGLTNIWQNHLKKE